MIAREEKGLFGVDYDRSPKTKFTTRQSNTNIAKDDPLPVTAEEAGGGTETGGEVEEVQQPVYNPEAADTGSSLINPPASGTAIGGIKLEIFMGIVIDSLSAQAQQTPARNCGPRRNAGHHRSHRCNGNRRGRAPR